MKRAATLVLVMLAMSASAAVDARALASEGPKTQWAPTRNFSTLNARAVFASESGAATSPYAGEEGETAAGGKEAGFTGHRFESVLGLTYAKRRWLDSSTGTWLSRDDIGAASYLQSPNELNPWQYAAGNPTRFTDPSGRAPMDQLAGQESRNQATATDINRRAGAGDPVAQKIQYGAFGALGVMGSPVLLACATPAGAPVCQALGMVALGGVFTSGQPTLTGLEQQVNACVAPQSPMDSLSCGFGAGATAIGAGSIASRLAPQGRAAVASMMLESSEMSLPATMARGASLEPAPLISIAEQSAAPAARAAPTPSLADLKPLYSGAFSAVSSQPSMSWANAVRSAQMNRPRVAELESWLPMRSRTNQQGELWVEPADEALSMPVVVGQYNPATRSLWVGMIEVPEQMRGQGVSTALYQRLLDITEATQGPVESVTGRLAFDNKAALRSGGIGNTPRARALRDLGFTETTFDAATGVATSRRPMPLQPQPPPYLVLPNEPR